MSKIFNLQNYEYYRCVQCNYLKRMPDDVIINYSMEYNSTDNISYSRKLAKNYFKRLTPEINLGATCLELGGSYGFFSRKLKEQKKCTVRNVELSKYASNYANEQGVITVPTINDLDIRKFDYIFSFHVIEHISPKEIKQFINNALNLLKPNGIFYIFTPNSEAFKIHLLKNKYPWLAPDQHISFLNKNSIKFILDGNQKIKFDTNEEIPAFTHYPLNSILAILRTKIFKHKVSDITGIHNNDIVNANLSFKSKIVILLKKIFHIGILIERTILYPFFLISDVVSTHHDELVIKIKKYDNR